MLGGQTGVVEGLVGGGGIRGLALVIDHAGGGEALIGIGDGTDVGHGGGGFLPPNETASEIRV